MMDVNTLRFQADGLIPAIIQDQASGTVLMLGYMNAESVQKTLDSGVTWFYSRSRQCLWQKGETSGHVQKVRSIAYDCDADALLIQVEQTGPACHTGSFSCFTATCENRQAEAADSVSTVLHTLYHTIQDRKRHPQEGSYTNYLFTKGQDKILKKVGEEAAETIIGSKNNDKAEVLYEMADLWYHCLVLLAYHEIAPSELLAELQSRQK